MAAGRRRRSSSGLPLPNSAPDAVVELVGNDGDDVVLRAARGHVNGAWYASGVQLETGAVDVAAVVADVADGGVADGETNSGNFEQATGRLCELERERKPTSRGNARASTDALHRTVSDTRRFSDRDRGGI